MTKVEYVAKKYGVKLVNGKATAGQYTKWVIQAFLAQLVIVCGWPTIVLGWALTCAPNFGPQGLAIWIASWILVPVAYIIRGRLQTIKAEFEKAQEYDYYVN